MKLSLAFLFILLQLSIFAQREEGPAVGDTTYYFYGLGELSSNGSNKIARSPEMEICGFSIIMPVDTTNHIDTIFHLNSHSVLAEYEAYDTYVGHNPRRADSRVQVNLTVKNGIYKEWFEDGTLKLKCEYVEDKLDGDYEMFYPEGEIKRRETWKDGEWVKGHCFDKNGVETEYCSYKKTPEFKGGERALYRFISKNISYPEEAMERNIQGIVHVQFLIKKDGSIADITIDKSVHKLLDEEAIELFTKMPDWNPGLLEGIPVNVYHRMPLNFRLE